MIRRIANLPPNELLRQVENTKSLIDLISSYNSSLSSKPIKSRPATSLDTTLPKSRRPFAEVLNQVEQNILPNNINWMHPMFFAYFPFINSWQSIQGSILSKSLGSVSFTKTSCPAAYEIEMLVSDWLSEMLGLPKHFYNKHGPGGGLTYETASEAVLTAMACAGLDKGKNSVVYVSDQAHFSIEKSARVLRLPIRMIPSYLNPEFGTYSINIESLKSAILQDKQAGLSPAMIVGCIGGTNVCSIDQNDLLADIADQEKMWFHIDAAYAGSFGILPELKQFFKGVENCTTLNINSSKMLFSGMGCSHMWVKDRSLLVKHLSQDSSYLKGVNDADLKNWQIPLGRDCKAMKSWFIIQDLGHDGIKEHLRRYIEATKIADEIVRNDERLELVVRSNFGLVVFRLKGGEEKTVEFLNRIGKDENIYLLGSKLYNKSIVRFTPCVITENYQNIYDAFRLVFSYLD